ncbi:MAG: sugar-binding protein [Verrucomicrobiia bacterium]
MQLKTTLALSLLALSLCQLKANDIQVGKEYYSAIRAPNPITVDGDLSEWSGVPVLADPGIYTPKGSGTNGTLVFFEEYNGGTWTGPDDQTSAVQIAYDDNNVYFGFVVTDDFHENSANSAWNGDSVQLMIASRDRAQQVALYNYALGGVEDALGDTIAEHEAGPGGDPACDCATEAVIKRNPTTKKTVYEIRLPKAALGLTALSGGTKFGLGMAINDGDELTPGQKGWSGLGAHSIVFGKTPGETALITLARRNDIEPGKEVYTANPAPKPIVLDGNLSEWSGVPVLADPKFSIPKGSGPAGTGTLVLFEEYNGGTWTGPDDQTSAVQIVYDAENVYFGFVVTDDYHENSANSPWNGDSVQLMIADGTQSSQVALYNYSLGGTEEALGETIAEHEAGPGGTEAVVTRNTTTKKTTYEIKLPKAALGLSALTYGTQFGLGMAINDGDELTPGQKGWGGLGAHSIVFGKTPGETALVTLGVGGTASDLIYLSAINPSVTGFSFRVNNLGASILDPASAKLFIDGVSVPLTSAAKGDATDFTYTNPDLFAPGSDHSYIIEVKDTKGNVVADAADFKTLVYARLAADAKVTPDTSKRGFIWRVHQNSAFQANNSSRPLEQLAGLLGRNYADPNAQGIAIGPGTAGANNQLPIQFEIDSTINMSPNGGGAFGDFPDDAPMPGVPGTDPNATEDGIAGEAITFIELPVGKHTFAMRSDDGFRTTAGNIADAFQAQTAADSAGAVATMVFNVYVKDAGVYAFRTVWEEGGGDAYLEWASVLPDGTKVLLNDTANGGLKAYRAITSPTPTAVSFVSPRPGQTAVEFDAPVVVMLQDGATAVDAASVKLTLDGAQVTAQATKSGNVTTLRYQPSTYFPSGSAHTASLTFAAGGTTRTETWTFTTISYPTLTKSHQAVSVDRSKPGFTWSVFQNETVTPNSLASAELALAGQLTGPDGAVLANQVEPNQIGVAVGPGVKVGPLYRFEIEGTLNVSQDGVDNAGSFTPDDVMPGIPGTTGSTDGIDAEVITYVELPAGIVTFAVVSDDSFRMQGGYISAPADAVLMHQVDGATANVTFRTVVTEAGVYPIRVIWQEGGGGANLELSSVKADGTRVLLNDTGNGGYRTFRAGVAPTKPIDTEFSIAAKVSGANIEITWTEPGAVLQQSSDLKTWTTVAGATSPYRAALTASSAVFYRLSK